MKQLILILSLILINYTSGIAQFAGGSGTEEDPYQVETVEQLQEIRNHTDKHFIQIADIDASDTESWNDGKGFNPIGDDVIPFTGSYNGADYVIDKLYINRQSEYYVGLFGYVVGVEISNVNIFDIQIANGNSYVGGIIANMNNSVLRNASLTGQIHGNWYVGGTVGQSNNSLIINTYTNANISISTWYVGGIAGINSSDSEIIESHSNSLIVGSATTRQAGGLSGANHGIIRQSYFTGDVNGGGDGLYAGGITATNSGEIIDSYSISSVSGNVEVGGLVGRNWESGFIRNSYSVSSVTGNDDIGALIGLNGGELANIYWDADATGQEHGIGRGSSDGATGLTTYQMKGVNAEYNMTGFAFGEVWALVSEAYPKLIWTLPYFKLEIVSSNAPISIGQSLIVEVNVENIGGIADTQSVYLKNDLGEIIDTFDNLVLESEQEELITLQWQTGEGDEGEYTFTIESEYDRHSFEFNVRTIPATVELTDPSNQQQDISVLPVLNWNQAELADHYQLQLSTSSDFSTIILDTDNLEALMYEVTDSLNHLTNYYWRVRGKSEIGDGDWSDIWSFTTIIEKPDVVELTSPDSGSVDIPIISELQWNLSERAEYYQVKLSKDTEFTEVVQDSSEITGVSFTPDELQYNTTYHWKVRAINVGGESEWSESRSFFTEFALPMPVLESPVPATEEVELPVVFYWHPVEEASDYTLEVSLDESFETVLNILSEESEIESFGKANESNTLTTQNSGWMISKRVEELDYDTQYFWRVHAENESGISDWSEIWSFTTEKAPITTPVTLLTPANESTDVAFPVELTWQAFEGAAHYDLQISESPAFTSTISEIDYESTSFTTTALEDTTNYYWRVRATVDEQKTAWSDTWSFQTGFSAESITEAPTHVTPENGAVRQPLSLYLIWNEVGNAENYELQLSTDSEFEQLHSLAMSDSDKGLKSAQDQSDEQLTTVYVDDLDFETTYFWRVRGINPGGSGPWSEPWEFSTIRDSEQGPELASPANESIDVAFPVELTWQAFEGAAHYDIELSVSAAFDTTISVKEFEGHSIDFTELSDTTTYYWRVRATVDEQKTAWSEVWSFETELRVPDIPSWSPDDGEENIATTPLLEWNTSNRAEYYDLQLTDDNSFEELVIDVQQVNETQYQVENELEGNTTYFWRVRAGNEAGYSEWSDVLQFTTEMTTSTEIADLPKEFSLEQNYPNPFNPTTTVTFMMPESSHVTVQVFNVVGQRVAELVNGQLSGGVHKLSFDASSLSSGMYLIRMNTPDHVFTRKMTLVK